MVLLEKKLIELSKKMPKIQIKKNISFYASLMNDSLINKKISNKDLRNMFDLNYHTKKIDFIYKRVFK